MQLSNRVLPKLVLPAVFFGYALWVSGSFIVDASQYEKELPSGVASVVDGQFTAKLEGIYKDRLPYRSVSTDLLGAARYLIFGEGRKGVVVGKDGWLFSSEEYRAASNEPKSITDAVSMVADVRDQLAARGTDLLVLPLPAKADIYREHTAYPSLSNEMEVRYDGFRTALAAQDIKTVDARSSLLAAKSEGELFLKGDTHWSPKGASVVAGATAEAAGSVVAPVPFTLSEGETLRVEGDLTKFIVSPEYASYVSLAPERVTRLRASAEQPADLTGADLFGGPSIDIALVGTSYSANENWSFAASLMGAMGADIVNFAEEGHGPFLPMRQYLDSDVARDTPPKLVIWEIPVRYLTAPDALAAMTAQVE
jgi:alginate O-acetyltransferase complex protein AlgJ